MLYVATMNDKLYAFDADQPSPTPLWMRDFTTPPSVTAVPITDLVVGQPEYHRQRRYPGTPVIDLPTPPSTSSCGRRRAAHTCSASTPSTSRPGRRDPGARHD